jgi:ubiquinone/menaquinone biosynthesis C-methylase UbiE
MGKQWTRQELLQMGHGYQAVCVLSAAADLSVFDVLASKTLTAPEIAGELRSDLRATTALLDALAAMQLLDKAGERYNLAAGCEELLTETRPQSVLPMLLHQGNCMRRWVQLARVVQTGVPAERAPSIRGLEADQASFIGAMHVVSGPVAEDVVRDVGPQSFRHLLDIGGGSGTWTIAWLRTAPNARATIFDLPDVIPMAGERLTREKLVGRVSLVPGDFYAQELPEGADFAWLSAIAHQNSRMQNLELFAKIHRALQPGGTLMIRDIVMDETRTQPISGAFFAINMLVATPAGGTYSLGEYREDLEATGFGDVRQVRRDEWMDSVVAARRL